MMGRLISVVVFLIVNIMEIKAFRQGFGTHLEGMVNKMYRLMTGF